MSCIDASTVLDYCLYCTVLKKQMGWYSTGNSFVSQSSPYPLPLTDRESRRDRVQVQLAHQHADAPNWRILDVCIITTMPKRPSDVCTHRNKDMEIHSKCEMESSRTRRVISRSLIFKRGIQRMQQTCASAKDLPCLLDPLNLDHIFMNHKHDLRHGQSDSTSKTRMSTVASQDDMLCSSSDSSTTSTVARHPQLLIDTCILEDIDCPSILNTLQFTQLRDALPDRFREATFERCFCLGRDGDCLDTLLYLTRHISHTMFVIETTRGEILGGYCTEPWSSTRQYHGTGQSFLYASHPEDSEGDGKLSIYPWTGSNDYCQVCDNGLAMGGQGAFGWVVCSELMRGQTGRCQTYGNPPLVKGGFFEIANLEVYGIVHAMLSARSQSSAASCWSCA
jgi:hypothetical protein